MSFRFRKRMDSRDVVARRVVDEEEFLAKVAEMDEEIEEE